MNIFRHFIILIGVSLCLFCADTEEAIRKNEVVIDALQKQLDSMQASGEKKEAIEALQTHIDIIIEQQNKLLAQKTFPGASPATSAPINNGDFDSRVRAIVQEELAKTGHYAASSHSSVPSNPYDTTHVPTASELAATKIAGENAPILPEQKSEAVSQYEVAQKLYEQGSYKEAAAGFGRIAKTYPKDPIVGKALVRLAYCLEKLGDIESASVVCEAAQGKNLDDLHHIDCQIIRLRFAKSKNNTEIANQILKSLQGVPLTPDQQKAIAEAKQQFAAVTSTKSAKNANEAKTTA